MLKRIATAETELGMFIHKLEGSWFKHPFWKSRFLLTDPETLADLRESEVEGVIIDTSKGRDVRPSAPEPAAEETQSPAHRATAQIGGVRPPFPKAPVARPQSRNAAPSPDLRSVAPQTMKREFGNAKLVADKSRKAISKVFLEARLGKTINTSQVEPVVEDIFASLQRNAYAFNGLMRCKNDNEYVYCHSLSVSALMISLARQMKLPLQDIREAGMAGLLMDIGVVHLPTDLSPTGGDYRNLEPKIRNQHVLLGHDVLKAAGDIPDQVLHVCMRHHELMDGSGYPQALKGAEIDQLSRMALICDRYDNLVSDGTNAGGLDPASAIGQLSEMGAAIDQEILQSLIEAIGVYPIGSMVRLRSERLAMVIEQTPSDHTHPVVRTFYSLAQDKRLKGENIDLANCYGADEIIGTADLSGLDLPEPSQLRETLFSRSMQEQ